MKKIIAAAAALLAAMAGAGAQNMYDAIVFSQNHYIGTARSMSMGNAVTAVGGDLGSIGINPAGSAVSGYSQFTITPGVTISSVTSAYSPFGEDAYGLSNRLSQTRMNLPNMGMTVDFATGRRRGVKSVVFGFVSNQTNSFNFSAEAFGVNGRTSKIAETASAALGMDETILKEYSSFNNSDYPWDLLSAYQGGMYGPYGFQDVYAGVTETISPNGDYHYVPGDLAQTAYLTKRGSKNDLIFNAGINISDRIYLGFNIGIPTARYRYSESFYEAPVNPDLFSIEYEDGGIVRFQRGTFNYQYTSDMAGIYAKFGIILRPIAGLRIGATIQSPTAYTITERWMYATATYYDDTLYNDDCTSPTGEFSYTLRSPYRASFGAAYSIGKMALVSVDYELADYSVMRFNTLRRNRMSSEDAFIVENMTNRYFCGVAHNLRIGGELKLTPEFAVRAGYTVATSPERYWTNNAGVEVVADDFKADFNDYFNHTKSLMTPQYYNDRTRSFAVGFGYSSPGSFFMDAAVRCTRYPAMTFSPYYDYVSMDKDGNHWGLPSPRVLYQRDLWNVMLTFGWRF